ncbi:DUF3995 domain-containing protein [Natronorubrum sp. FCH18a]|uniref:DUF3995 domain-containing protein n=1 Tax=Natronorubrum sp. FCH18a TaxID=3447018 RepID=UPI003F511A9C
MNPTRPSTSSKGALLPTLAGYAACVWAFLFGVVHIYWAIGGTVGLQGNPMTGMLFLINLAAIPLCFVAAVVALGLVRSWTQYLSHWMWLTATSGAGLLLTLRGGVGLLQTMLSENHVPLLLMAYDSWFLLGGILFGTVSIARWRE